jgi:hypothetical protein
VVEAFLCKRKAFSPKEAFPASQKEGKNFHITQAPKQTSLDAGSKSSLSFRKGTSFLRKRGPFLRFSSEKRGAISRKEMSVAFGQKKEFWQPQRKTDDESPASGLFL